MSPSLEHLEPTATAPSEMSSSAETGAAQPSLAPEESAPPEPVDTQAGPPPDDSSPPQSPPTEPATTDPEESNEPPFGVSPPGMMTEEVGEPSPPSMPTETTAESPPEPPPGAGSDGSRVTVDGRRLVVDGAPFHVQGVCWNPIPLGASHPQGLDYAGYADQDIALMQAAHVNAVRTYEPLTDLAVLDKLDAAGIVVLSTVYPYGGNDVASVRAHVQATQDHPAIAMWVIGNEWNYNGLYVDLPHDECVQRINQVAEEIRALDSSRPIMTIYGGVPDQGVIDAMPGIDVWGVNFYGGLSFGDSFSQWAARSQKPLVMTEYGADAYNTNTGAYDPEAQAEATRTLAQLIADNSSADDPDAVCAGGTIFEWADEWWKDGAGSADAQDVGGIAPGGGPHPDQVFNEEWWGIVDIERNPRPAYTALQEVFAAR